MTGLSSSVRSLREALAGESLATDHACDGLLHRRLISFLGEDNEAKVIQILHPDFNSHEPGRERCFRFIVATARAMTRNWDFSIDSLTVQLGTQSVIQPHLFDDRVTTVLRGLLFSVMGWLTLLYKAQPADPASPLTVDASEFSTSTLLISHLPSAFANRSFLEMLRNLGDVLPLPSVRDRDQYQGLSVATLNIATLTRVGKVNIHWVDSVGSHLEFDPMQGAGGTVKLFRYPSILALQCSGNSMLSNILAKYYDDIKDPNHSFTVVRFAREVTMSYSLIFRFDHRARKLYRSSQRDAAGCGGTSDPLLDELCLGHAPYDMFSAMHPHKHHVKESFDANVDFPLLSSRLVYLQSHIDGIQPNRIHSLWQDKRDILRWYTFWAVIVIGGLNLILAGMQAAFSAAQVAIAQKSLLLQTSGSQDSS